MSLLLSKLLSSIIQIIVFSLIPFIWWLVTARKECSFFEWIGLKKMGGKDSKPLLWICGISAILWSRAGSGWRLPT